MAPITTENPVAAVIAPASQPASTGRLGLTANQWKSAIAAWLGWMFDGLDMHLYLLIATPFVASLLQTADNNPLVKSRISWIQAAFLVGWALGGGFFGRIGDRLGRSKTLALTVLTYAAFTGLSFFAQTWWELLIFRFLAALGIGGEWAVGSSLLSETWPAKWRPWAAATLQTGVNIGVIIACIAAAVLSMVLGAHHERAVFLVGVAPALLVFWIRKSVPESHEWVAAQKEARSDPANQPGIADLFRGEVRRITILTICVCATALTAWWGFMFWSIQHLPKLPDVATWAPASRDQLKYWSFLGVISVSIVGNYFAAFVAQRIGYRRAVAVLNLGFFGAMFGAYCVPHSYQVLLAWMGAVGFFSGVFGLFTMYLPPLFPTLLRTTGAGFSYNIGRIVAAAGTVIFGLFASNLDFRVALLYNSFLLLPSAAFALFLPDLHDAPEPKPAT